MRRCKTAAQQDQAMTDTTQLPLIVEPGALPSPGESTNLLLVDLSQPETYIKHHLHGAVFLEYAWILRREPPVMGLLPDARQLANVLGAIGMTPQTHVVAYDDEGGGRACRFLWTLDAVGHTRYSLLNGGLHAWLDEGPAEYAAFDYYRGVYGQEAAEDLMSSRWRMPYAVAATNGIDGPIDQAAGVMSDANYELLTYAKAALFFDTLRGWLGDEMYGQVMRAYVDTYRWRIVTPQHFLGLAQTQSDVDLDSLAEQWLR